MFIDLVKFYFEITLKANAYFYLVTGGILTFYFAHPEASLIRFSLVFPSVMGVVLAGIFLFGAFYVRPIGEELRSMRVQLGLKVEPDVRVLTAYLLASAVILIVVAVSMVVLICLHIQVAAQAL